ncbi:amino acid adenylation domain-containing protein [Streptomyces sp. NPDC049627]|uniref:amino acid adenylation domain-containing protein n=1 Tax=Streptomyces sp. NPDC049627 TaxID=3365595 RepID=UPI0037954333
MTPGAPDSRTELLDLVDTQLATAPASAGVTCGGRFTPYSRIDAWAREVADALRGAGVDRGDIVPVASGRGAAMVAGWLGVLRAGAAYLPIDIDLPDERVAYLAADSKARVALVDASPGAPTAAFDSSVTVLGIDDLPMPVPSAGPEPGADTGPAGASAAGPELAESDPACVLYTSGSTGRPKGVVIDHGTLLQAALRWCWLFPFERGDRILSAASVSFDAGNADVAAALVSGADLILATDAQRRDPALLAPLLTAEPGVSAMFGTPSAVHAALADVAPGTGRVRHVVMGGEVLTGARVREARAKLGCRVTNVWGVTEAPAITTTHTADPDTDPELPGIGTPVPNTRVYLLGPNLEPVPDGAVGELYIAGAGVAGGYFGNPSLTARRFLPDPWSEIPGARMFATRDLAVLRPDGGLEYRGRADQQVKVNGNRVELGEVQALLEAVPGVRSAAVLADREADRDRLVGYVEVDESAPPTAGQVRTALRRWLPAAVVPTSVRVVATMPRSAHGKLDVAALRSAPWRKPAAAADENGPNPADRSADHDLSVRLFARALGRDEETADFAADADFFALGGTSMIAARMITEAQTPDRPTLALRDFLADPTVGGLAKALAAAASPCPSPEAAASGTASSPAAPPDAGHSDRADDTFPADSAQRRLWILNQVPSYRTAYLVPGVLELTGPVDPQTLCLVVRRVLERHPMLRARFRLAADGRGVEGRLGPPPDVGRLDAAGLDDAALAAHVDALCGDPFDLRDQAPVRAEVITHGARTLLVLCAHHIAVDGVSLRLLLGEIATTYRARRSGAPDAALPPTRLPAPPATTRERTDDLVASLRGAPTDVLLPHDRLRPQTADTAAASCPVPLDTAVAARITDFAAEHDVSVFMVLAAAVAVALARRSGQRDFLLTSPWAGREDADRAEAIGMLVNTLAIRADLRGARTWTDVLDRVRTSALTAYRHADVPFDDVVARLQPERDLSRPPLTPVEISLSDGVLPPMDLGAGVAARWLPTGFARAKYELVVDARTTGAGLDLAVDYVTALFDAATGARIAADLGRALTDLVTTPTAGLGLPETGPALPVALGALPGAPDDTLIHRDTELTRAELDAWAWGVATRLRAAGIGPGDVVPVVAARGPGMVAGWLGVLRAGAAYTPVSADVPQPRLAYIAREVRARVVLVDDGARAAVDDLAAVDITGLSGPATAPPPVTGADPAAVLFTSGTTGHPKGVVVTHGNLTSYIAAMHGTYPRLVGTRHLLASTADTDFSGTVVLAPIATGGSTVIADDAECLDGRLLADLVRRHRIEVVKFTPSHAARLLDTPFGAALRAVDVLVLGGEPITATLAGALAAARPPGTLTINHYGPTETTIGAVTHVLDPGVPEAPPVGRPLPNVRVLVLDEDLRPVPDGEAGMLWMGGPQVTAGYLRRPAETARAYRLLAADAGAGPMYRTGDVAVRSADGTIRLHGRMDDQVKIRGFRVEPGEVRAALLALPEVRQAEVLGHEGRLVAFAVLDGGRSAGGAAAGADGGPDAAAGRHVLDRLRSAQPGHLVPELLVPVPAIPLARTGKADRAALRALLAGEPGAVPGVEHRASVPPGASVPAAGASGPAIGASGPAAGASGPEQKIRAIWCALLDRPDVGLDQPFFEAGGNSLLLIALLERLRGLGARDVAVGDLFSHVTVRAQAALLARGDLRAEGGRPATTGRRDGLAARRSRARAGTSQDNGVREG